jgi:predicted transcriptional regulator
MKVQNYKFNEEGLNHFFGPLEARVMEIIWDSLESISIKEVHQRLDQETPLNFNTVMTVMNRLVEKSHLKKNSSGRASLFKAVQTKQEFLTEQTKEMAHELIEEFGDLVVSHMVDALDKVDEKLLQQLEDKLNQLKKRK